MLYNNVMLRLFYTHRGCYFKLGNGFFKCVRNRLFYLSVSLSFCLSENFSACDCEGHSYGFRCMPMTKRELKFN